MPIVGNMRMGDMATNNPIPDGTYHVRIAKIEKKGTEEAKASPDKYEYANVAYVVTGNSPEEYHGRQVFENCTFKPGSNFAARQLGAACGLTEEDDFVEKLDEGFFQDAELLIAVGTEKERTDKNTGKTYPERNNVKKRMPLDS